MNEIRNNRTIGKVLRLLAAVALICFLCLSAGACGKSDSTEETASQTQAKTTTEPTEAEATEPLASIFFVSDYQIEDGWPSPAENLEGIMSRVKEEGEKPETFAFLGDYTNDMNLHDHQLSPEESISQIRGIVDEKFPGGSDSEVFVQGNHDKMTESISETGLHEYDDYLIYVLNTEEDFPWKQGRTAGCLSKVKKSSEDMKKCFDELIHNNETRPVFITGHVPLHFTARTSTRHTTGDNLYSSLIFDVVNQAAGELDIVYLFGHNHSKGWDCYMGGSSVYTAPGESLLIPDFDESDVSTDEFTEDELKFTYMNAGYCGYYMNCGPEELAAGTQDQYHAADETLTASVCQIWPDRLVITRYSADGSHPLRWDGEADPYKGNIDADLIDQDHYSHRLDGPAVIERKAR